VPAAVAAVFGNDKGSIDALLPGPVRNQPRFRLSGDLLRDPDTVGCVLVPIAGFGSLRERAAEITLEGLDELFTLVAHLCRIEHDGELPLLDVVPVEEQKEFPVRSVCRRSGGNRHCSRAGGRRQENPGSSGTQTKEPAPSDTPHKSTFIHSSTS